MTTADPAQRRRRPRADIAETTGSPAAPSRASRLPQTDLDLLPILRELLRTKSVSRTARALGITQPAVSQALRRLRATFGDDLLVPLGRDLALTDRAAALARPLEGILEAIDLLLQPAASFDPAIEELRVVIQTTDYVSLLLAPLEEAGLAITPLSEPLPDLDHGRSHMAHWTRIPLFLWLKAQPLAP